MNFQEELEKANRILLAGMKAGRQIGRQELESDCMTLALRLYGEDENTFAPETKRVMDKWRPRCAALLNKAPT